MIGLLFFSLVLIGTAVLVFKKIKHLALRYFLLFIHLLVFSGIIWIFLVAVRSGEM